MEFLAQRSWKGLEVKRGETQVTKAVEGRSGIASGYTHELVQDDDNTLYSNMLGKYLKKHRNHALSILMKFAFQSKSEQFIDNSSNLNMAKYFALITRQHSLTTLPRPFKEV